MVPQHVRTPPNKLRNHPFRNMYTDPYTCCGMGGSATHWEVFERVAEPPIPQFVYGFVYMLRNGWFRNIFEHLVVLLRRVVVVPLRRCRCSTPPLPLPTQTSHPHYHPQPCTTTIISPLISHLHFLFYNIII